MLFMPKFIEFYPHVSFYYNSAQIYSLLIYTFFCTRNCREPICPGRSAYIGLGFGDRSDSFDLNVALQDHFKWIKVEAEAEKPDTSPALDLGFKEGQTIKINMKIAVSDNADRVELINYILLYTTTLV